MCELKSSVDVLSFDMINLYVGGREQKLTFRGNEELHLLFHTAGTSTVVVPYQTGTHPTVD